VPPSTAATIARDAVTKGEGTMFDKKSVGIVLVVVVLVALAPGCTFYTEEGGKTRPRTAAEVEGVSPVIYTMIAVFTFLVVISVVALIAYSARVTNGDQLGTLILPALLAVGATVVVALLVG
jgi:heme/copper-type cytochrome/quinol oxidase subunit 2